MTREQAINYLRSGGYSEEQINAVVEALTDKDCVSREAVLEIINNPLNIRLDAIIKKLPSVTPKPKTEQEPILDKIRAEIVNKAESGQWSEAVKYGMLKAILIIDKYKAESEDGE